MTDYLPSPGIPRSEFDRSIESLIARANDVRDAQGRLRALLRATRAVVEEIELGVVLKRIVQAAATLADAEYCALGVIAADGHSLEAFIHEGMDEEHVAAMGRLPQGRGLLGAVIADPEPIRLAHLADDPRSVGLPPGHPPMEGFLGVPIRVRGSVFGNLYLTNPRSGEFSDEDEQLVEALAATAAFAIDHARTLIEARTRERWMTSSAEIAAALLDSDRSRAYSVLADELISRSGSQRISIVVPGEHPGTVLVVAARGLGADVLDGQEFPIAQTVAGEVLDSGVSTMRPLTAAAEGEPRDPFAVTEDGVTGATAYIALTAGSTVWGVLVAARVPDQPGFSRTDLEVGVDLGERISVALELARAREDQQRMLLLEDRGRIARDLHDHVIQDLFGTGLELQGATASANDRDRETIAAAVQRLDAVIAQIRKIVFALSPPDGDRTAATRHRILDIAADASKALPNPVDVGFSGAVDLFVSGELADDVAAVVRELLSNVVRHSGATEAGIAVTVGTEDIRVVVTDDGIGIPATAHLSGLTNLRTRATTLGGGLDLTSSADGTRITWWVPIPDREEES